MDHVWFHVLGMVLVIGPNAEVNLNWCITSNPLNMQAYTFFKLLSQFAQNLDCVC